MGVTVCSRCSRGQHDLCTAEDACGCQTCNPPVVVWEEPPPKKRPGVSPITDEQIEELRSHPKRWARIRTYETKTGAGSVVGNYKRGTSSLPAGLELEGRRTDDGRSVLYGRWVGIDEAAA